MALMVALVMMIIISVALARPHALVAMPLRGRDRVGLTANDLTGAPNFRRRQIWGHSTRSGRLGDVPQSRQCGPSWSPRLELVPQRRLQWGPSLLNRPWRATWRTELRDTTGRRPTNSSKMSSRGRAWASLPAWPRRQPIATC